MSTYLMSTYRTLPVRFVRGEGAWLWDDAGRRYLDAQCGLAVTGLGHAHPAVTEAIVQQAQRLLHVSNQFQIPAQIALAQELCQASHMDKAFFCNSGTEANEAAFKLTRLWANQRQIKNPQIVVASGAFHGRTFSMMSAGNPKYQVGFNPLVSGFIQVPFNDLGAISSLEPSNIVAVWLEPIQGENGIILPDTNYLSDLAKLCRSRDWLFVLDEIQTGMGRTGRLFAHQYHDFVPDILTVAKGLANGIPIGACLARGPAAQLFTPGSHGSTFGGNPLACEVGRVTLRTILQENLAERAAQSGAYLLAGLRQLLKDHPLVQAIRGQGLMIGIELNRPCLALKALALQHGIVLNVTRQNVIRLTPPLIIEPAQLDLFLEQIPAILDEFDALGDECHHQGEHHKNG